MAQKTVDLTQQPHRTIFSGCSQEDINYAKTFWQSVQLLPPMESRLVSSDIKQRLKKAPSSQSISECASKSKEQTEKSKAVPSFSFTLSNSSCSKSKYVIRTHSQVSSEYSIGPPVKSFTDSLKTQTSLLPNFFISSESIEHCPRLNISAEEESSCQMPEKDQKAKLSGVQKADGTKFQYRERNIENFFTDKEPSRKIEPFSGEDICQREGFITWRKQKVLTAQDQTELFAGEEATINENKLNSLSNEANESDSWKNKQEGFLGMDTQENKQKGPLSTEPGKTKPRVLLFMHTENEQSPKTSPKRVSKHETDNLY